MREFQLVFDELGKGLRPSDRQVRNSNYMTELFNLRVSGTGLEPYIPVTDMFSGVALNYTWPFPQLVTMEKYRILIDRDVIAGTDKVYEVASDLSLTLIVSADYPTFGQGDRWEVADFGEYVVLTNGVLMIYRDTVANTFVPILALTATPRCNTICNFKGQLIGGAVQSTWHSCGDSHIVWSQIGNVSCTPTENNEAGYRKVPFEGDAYKVKRLGDFVMVYCEHGILLMSPVVQPAATFGFKELSQDGLINPFAVGGNEFEHVYIDTKGYMWRVKSDLNRQKLDYHEYMDELTAENIIIEHDPVRNDYYISDGVKSFLLSDFGLSEIGEAILSIYHLPNGLLVDLGDNEARLTTDLQDMGLAGFKTSHVVEVGADGSGNISAGLDYRMNRKDALASTGFVEVNNEGVSTIRIAGVDYRISIKCSDFTDFHLDYFKLRYNMSDLRSIRGVYAPPPRGQ